VVAAVVVVVLIVLSVMALSGDDEAPGQVATTSGFEADAESNDQGGLAPVERAPDDTLGAANESDDTGPSVVPLGEPSDRPTPSAGNLLTDGANPAIDDLSVAIGADTPIIEIIVYDTYAIAEYQDATQPENIDRVIWRDGTVSEPEPVGFSDDNTAARFMIDDIDPSRIPPLTTEALERFDLEGGVVTHVIIDRFFGLDDGGVALRVYVSNPDRGGGGYLLARVDGTVVDLVQ
jgi:hypothetical protein